MSKKCLTKQDLDSYFLDKLRIIGKILIVVLVVLVLIGFLNLVKLGIREHWIGQCWLRTTNPEWRCAYLYDNFGEGY